MQVNLKESEISRAVELYLNKRGITTQNMDVAMRFSMGKGSNGLSVQIDIEGDVVFDETPTAPIKVLESPDVVADTSVKPGTVMASLRKHSDEVMRATATVAAHSAIVEAGSSIDDDVPPWEVEAPDHPAELAQQEPEPVFHGGDINPNADEGGEVSDETQGVIGAADQPDAGAPEPEPEPVVTAKPATPVRKPMFAKKTAAAVEPVAVAAEPELSEAGDDAGVEVAPADAEPVPEVKPAVIRRTAATLFKPKSA